MKIVYLLGAALLVGAGSASANDKIDARGQQLLDMYKTSALTPETAHGFIAVPASRSSEALVDVLVQTTDAAVIDSLEACGYAVEYISPRFSIVCMPVDGIENLAQSNSVSKLFFGHSVAPAMDIARGKSSVNTLHSGLTLPQRYRGTGVLVGMFDTGFDPSHINFLSADGSQNRLKFYARYSGSSTTPTVYTDDATRTAPTDNRNETHGTHVAGIMGGAYNGAGSYPGGKNTSTVNLYGVAPDAELAISAGDLYNNSILAGVRRIINYAKQVDKPVVINLSLGGNDGPHDGSDAFSQALDDLGKEAIICVAAGNEGGDYIHAGKTFTAADKELKTLLNGNKLNAGMIDVWSSTGDEIKVSIITVKANSGEITSKITSENNRTVTCGNGEGADHSIFRNAYNGTITLTAKKVDNRYNVSVGASSDVSAVNGSDVVLGIMIEGAEGVRVDAYGNGNRDIRFATVVPNGYDRPDNNGSINSMGCGSNIITVGSYSTRAQWQTLTGGRTYSTGGGDGNLSTFSSWGELVDGRKLPHICAPGTGINSSVSGPFMAANYDDNSYMLVASAQEGETTHYWACMNGTSMATPYVTGTVALWLQADPTLDVAKVRRIMMETAKKDDFVTDDIAWGAGKLDATKGIKQVIEETGAVDGITVAGSDIMVNVNGKSLDIFAAGAASVSAQLYAPSGMLAASASADGENLVLEAPSAGMYVLSVKAGAAVKTMKLVVR